MPSVIFSDLFLKRLKPNPSGQFQRFDKKTPGLGIRVSPGGTKAFVLCYRVARRNRRLALGRYPTMSLSEARERAREGLGQVARGIDPANEKSLARDTYQSSLFPTVLDDFIENYAKRKTRSWRETDRILHQEFVAVWRKLPITQITRHTMNSVLDAIVKRGTPSAANHAFAAIRRFFNWCVERGHLDHSPCIGMKAPSKVVSRDRVLKDEELAAIWLAAEKMGWPFGSLVQLLILTGQRRNEISGLCWQHLDLDQGLWTQPAEGNKSARVHVVPLSPLASQIIRSLPRVHDKFVFPARGKDNPISGFSKWKRKLDELSGVRNWTLHDLRRTAATGMAALSVPPHIVELVLNHQSGTLGGIAGIYNRFQYLEERRQALERWSEHLDAVIRKAHRPTETPIHAADGKGAGHGGLSPHLNHMSKYRGI
jgi:integrase